jgi:hypothetical protein
MIGDCPLTPPFEKVASVWGNRLGPNFSAVWGMGAKLHLDGNTEFIYYTCGFLQSFSSLSYLSSVYFIGHIPQKLLI